MMWVAEFDLVNPCRISLEIFTFFFSKKLLKRINDSDYLLFKRIQIIIFTLDHLETDCDYCVVDNGPRHYCSIANF